MELFAELRFELAVIGDFTFEIIDPGFLVHFVLDLVNILLNNE
jgi:hypothetical protein